MKVDPSQLKAFLLDSSLANKSQLEKAEKEAQKSGQRLEDILVKSGVAKEEELTKLKAYILGIPFVNLEDEKIAPEILQIIPEPIARKQNIVAFRKNGRNLEVAMLDPDDLQTIEFIRKKANLKILPRLTSAASIKNILRQYQKSLKAEFGEIIGKEASDIMPIVTESAVQSEDLPKEELEKAAQDLPVIKIVDTLVKHAILQKASDIHIEPMEKELIVRYRVDGILHETMTLPKQIAPGVVARIKVLSNLKLDEHRLPQDGRFKIETNEYKISFRVSILPVFDGEKVVMRLLPEGSKGLSLEKLGFWGRDLEIIHRQINKPTGLILVTGPTGCGKTTTLYTLMDILNTPDVNISTVEDPIEYRMPRINQTQVSPKIGLTFASGLRSLLRQDPDIIMVGEIRDNETASLAINASLTGHLVLSTLHTNSAAGSLPRLIDMKAEPFLIASTINCIEAQRLVRCLNPESKEKYRLDKAEMEELSKQINLEKVLEAMKREKIIPKDDKIEDIDFFRPKPTPDCPDGYKDRIGIHEIVEITETLKEMIVKQATSDQIEKQARSEGMITMLEDGFIKAAKGITSLEEVLRATSE
ncbi:MAG: type II secretion system protein E (GspE), type IV pilus assembly protein PilB [Parcubacteria group bacterium GW2011_GWC1_43_12]|nr:MAG: Type II secretion system protein E [Parcubacteria group bacterium GW2011_GWB1_42_6]KKS91314.1 MAG: type II secretion system protein E (GspE), type IV pilus assembly protein PilB [Parcubacteria group bacterium GW2011_GWC1_43_12]